MNISEYSIISFRTKARFMHFVSEISMLANWGNIQLLMSVTGREHAGGHVASCCPPISYSQEYQFHTLTLSAVQRKRDISIQLLCICWAWPVSFSIQCICLYGMWSLTEYHRQKLGRCGGLCHDVSLHRRNQSPGCVRPSKESSLQRALWELRPLK